MEKRKTFIVLGSPLNGELLLEADLPNGAETCWTLHKTATAGDRILFYITAPVSGIVAVGTMRGESQYQSNPTADWYKHYLGAVEDLHLTRIVPMRSLRAVFPEWNALKYFRQNAPVPENLVPLLLEMLEVNEDDNYGQKQKRRGNEKTGLSQSR